MTPTSPHTLCDRVLFADTETLPLPFPFLIFREPASVRVSVRVSGALQKKSQTLNNNFSSRQGCH